MAIRSASMKDGSVRAELGLHSSSARIHLVSWMYLLQVWFNLSDESTEDAVYDSYAMKRFLWLNFTNESVPDATTLGNFRHLMEENNLSEMIFEDVKSRLDRARFLMHGGSILDATIVSAPSSTKNTDKKRDPQMHSTKKGNQWFFGMKIHSGVDVGGGYVHTITAMTANASDISEARNLIREDDEVVYGDSGYLGLEKRKEIKEDEQLSQIECRICRRPSQSRITSNYAGDNWDKTIEHPKVSVRYKVEHPLLIVKRQLGYSKTVYRGLTKNLARFFMLFACANLCMCLRVGRKGMVAKDYYDRAIKAALSKNESLPSLAAGLVMQLERIALLQERNTQEYIEQLKAGYEGFMASEIPDAMRDWFAPWQEIIEGVDDKTVAERKPEILRLAGRMPIL